MNVAAASSDDEEKTPEANLKYSILGMVMMSLGFIRGQDMLSTILVWFGFILMACGFVSKNKYSTLISELEVIFRITIIAAVMAALTLIFWLCLFFLLASGGI